MSGWFGALYRESTEDLLTPRLSLLEAEVIAALLRLRAGERVLDLGCGAGRHLAALAGRGLRLVGVDRDEGSLVDATSTPTRTSTLLVRADFLALPFAPIFDAAYAWYSSLFLLDDQGNQRALAEAARVLRPGGRLLVQHANPLRLVREPVAEAVRSLPGGGLCHETSRYDPETGTETLARTLERGGRVLAGSVRLRYYNSTEWEGMAGAAGLRLSALASTGAGAPAPFSEHAVDLVAVLEKPR